MPSRTSGTPRGARARSRRLEVHIINGGYGESIIVRLPDGHWGVVDCFAHKPSDPDTNPTVHFLKGRNVKHLEFICLTHPHDDHFRGMSQVLSSFRVKRFWRFPGLSREHLKELIVQRRVEAERWGDQTSQEAINDLQSTLRLVGNLRNGVPPLQVESPTANTVLYPWPVRSPSVVPNRLEIRVIAPPGNSIEGFLDSLQRCFTVDGSLATDLPSLRCNDISLALLIQYGETRVILGGDVEKSSWESVLKAVDVRDLSVQAVKVSHHGSRTGYCARLWRVFSARGKPVAVITPSLKHRLPTRDAVEHIQRHADAVYVTCPRAVVIEGAHYEFPDHYSIEEQAAIRAEMPLFRRARHQPGICSLSFDSLGQPPGVTLRNGAGQMTV